MSRGRNGGAGGAKGARRATGAAPAAVGRGKGRWSARRKMTVELELLRGAELEATSRQFLLPALVLPLEERLLSLLNNPMFSP